MEVTVSNNGTDERSQAVLLTPKFTGKMAVVDLKTIKRLAALLPRASFNQIKNNMIDVIRDTENLEQFVSVLEEELAFHMSINLITEYEEPTLDTAPGGADVVH